MPDIDAIIDRIARVPFRARFHLRQSEREQVVRRGMTTVRSHARDFIASRLAPAEPKNDGRQTPWGGHPVFRGQHATATCCRSCLRKNHGIPSGVDLTEPQQRYVVDVLCRWIAREMSESDLAGTRDQST